MTEPGSPVLDHGRVRLEALAVAHNVPLWEDPATFSRTLGIAWDDGTRTGSIVHALATHHENGATAAAVFTFVNLPSADCRWQLVHEERPERFQSWNGAWKPRPGHGPDTIADWCAVLEPVPGQPPWLPGMPSTTHHATFKLRDPDRSADFAGRHHHWRDWVRANPIPGLGHDQAAQDDAVERLTGAETGLMNRWLEINLGTDPAPARWDPARVRVLFPQQHPQIGDPARRLTTTVLAECAAAVADNAERILTEHAPAQRTAQRPLASVAAPRRHRGR